MMTKLWWLKSSKKFFRRNARDYSKNKQVRRSFHNFRKKKDFSKEPHICYECKGRGHIAGDCGNKKSKYKLKSKAMVVTWNDDSDESKDES